MRALGRLEVADELAADDLALLLGVGDAGQRAEELVLGVDDLQVDAGGGDEVLLDLLGLALPQQAVVDEHAGELVADRRCTRAAATAESTPPDSPQMARPRRRPARGSARPAPRRCCRGPGRPAAGDVVEEVLEHLLPVLGVQHLGVPLHAGQPAVDVLERGDRRARRSTPGRRSRPAPRSPRRRATSTRCARGMPAEQRARLGAR